MLDNKLRGIELPNGSVYWPIPKAGCTFIRTILANHYGYDATKVNNGDPGFKYVWDVDHSKYNYAFIRNPVDRILSLYADKIQFSVDRKVFPDQDWFAGMSLSLFLETVDKYIAEGKANRHYIQQMDLLPQGVKWFKMEEQVIFNMFTPLNTSHRQYTVVMSNHLKRIQGMYPKDFMLYGY